MPGVEQWIPYLALRNQSAHRQSAPDENAGSHYYILRIEISTSLLVVVLMLQTRMQVAITIYSGSRSLHHSRSLGGRPNVTDENGESYYYILRIWISLLLVDVLI